MNLSDLRERARAFAKTSTGRRLIRVAKVGFTTGILAYLVYRLTDIGWGTILTSLPQTPWFYIIFVGMYLTLPLSEVLIYGRLWSISGWKALAPMLKKRVYNKDVLGYSGDIYLYMWARERVDMPDRHVLHTVKDNVIVSSIASTLVAIVLLTAFVLTGQIALPTGLTEHTALYLTLALVGGAVLVALGVRFRRSLVLLPGLTLLAIFGVHVMRLLVVQGLQVLQWSVVIPEVPLHAWLTFLAVQIIVSRIPLLPSRDLLFLGASLEVAHLVEVSSAAVAGMLLVHGVLDKTVNLILFAVLSLQDRRARARSAPAQAPPAQPAPSSSEKQPAETA